MNQELNIISETVAEDNLGNRVQRNGCNIYLLPKSSKYSSCLGTIDSKKRALLCNVSRYTDHFRKFQGYVFNAYILKHASLFDKMIIQDELGVYEFYNEQLLNDCDYVNTQNGMMSFILVPESYLTKNHYPF